MNFTKVYKDIKQTFSKNFTKFHINICKNAILRVLLMYIDQLSPGAYLDIILTLTSFFLKILPVTFNTVSLLFYPPIIYTMEPLCVKTFVKSEASGRKWTS